MTLARRASRLFQDLRRRRVFRVAAAYLAIAFVALQVAEIVFPALGQDRGLTLAVLIAIIGFPVTVVLAWLYDLSPMGVVRTPPLEAEGADSGVSRGGGLAPGLGERAPDDRRRTVAVLPFEQAGDDPEDRYFSDGVHEDILTSLSKVSDLRVVARASVLRYRGAAPDPRRLGAELGVGTILEGSVRRSPDGRVRISARLVDVDSEQNVWAETYDRSLDDIFRIQQDVALQIVRALRAELSDEEEERLSAAPTGDLEAYDLYLRGRFLWNERTERSLAAAAAPLEAAVERDPGFTLAHAGLADVYLTQALYGLAAPESVMPRALAAAERALGLDPAMGEALAARGCVRALWRWDWEGALSDLGAAVRARPSYATAHQWIAIHVLVPLERFDEAHAALERARALDPGSAAIRASVAFTLYLERRWDEAEEVCRALADEMPAFALGHQFLGLILHRQGDHAAALVSLERARGLRGPTPEMRATLAPLLAAVGRPDEARAVRDELAAPEAREWVSPTRLAHIDVALGEPEAALDRLESALEVRATDLVWLRTDPAFDPLRGERRFAAFLDRMGLATLSPRESGAPPVGQAPRSPR